MVVSLVTSWLAGGVTAHLEHDLHVVGGATTPNTPVEVVLAAGGCGGRSYRGQERSGKVKDRLIKVIFGWV